MSRIIALLLLSLSFLCFPTHAKEKKFLTGKAPHASAYEGLLPAGMTVAPATGFHPSQLQGKRVALVPSANLNEWARVWSRVYEEGGFESHWSSRLIYRDHEKNRDRHRGYENNTDPRNFTEQVIQALQPHVGEIFVAEDLPHARDAGADYYLILDGWFGLYNTVWNSWFHTHGGVYLLDEALRQAFSVHGEAKEKYETPSLMKSWSPNAYAEIMDRQSGKITREMTDKVISDMQRQLIRSH